MRYPMERRRNVIRPFYQKSRFKAAPRIVLLDPSFLFFFSPSLSIVLILLRYRLACPKLLIPRENSRHRQVETDRRETSKCPRTQRRRAIISLTLDSPVRLVSANLIIRDQVRRIPLHTYAYSTARRGEAHGERNRERGRERERPGFPWSYRYKGPRTYVGTLYL